MQGVYRPDTFEHHQSRTQQNETQQADIKQFTFNGLRFKDGVIQPFSKLFHVMCEVLRTIQQLNVNAPKIREFKIRKIFGAIVKKVSYLLIRIYLTRQSTPK